MNLHWFAPGGRGPEKQIRFLEEAGLKGNFGTIWPSAETGADGVDSEKIIIAVDDEASVLRYLVTLLNRPGYKVHEANGPLQALAALEKLPTPPHLLVTDFRMEPINGLELATRVKLQSPDVRVLYISGFSESNDLIANEVASSQSDFLPKPFTPVQLLRKVESLLVGL